MTDKKSWHGCTDC